MLHVPGHHPLLASAGNDAQILVSRIPRFQQVLLWGQSCAPLSCTASPVLGAASASLPSTDRTVSRQTLAVVLSDLFSKQ